MIDFHTHILPGVDDGARTPRDSIALLRRLREDGVTRVALTPHFYADETPPRVFFPARERAYRSLLAALPPGERFPEMKLGAEVHYYSGISHLDCLPNLCLAGTNLLLLEMPFSPWEGSALREVLEIGRSRALTVSLAHVERYRGLASRGMWEDLLAGGVLFQVNAESFLSSPLERHRALRALSRGEIAFLGSDCHDLRRRPPRMGELQALLTEKCKADDLAAIGARAAALWNGTN